MLTKRRKQILDFLVNFKNSYGHVPTIREICSYLGLKSTNGIYEHLKALERDGYIETIPNKARNIKLKNNKNSLLPLLGEVSAGDPIYPMVTEGDYIEMPIKMEKKIALKVRGDSMIKAGIQSGDMVVIDTERPVKNKDIVAVIIDGEVTIKRLYINKNSIELHPENDDYSIISIGQKDFKIIGKVMLLMRNL